jgi:N-acetylneuraminate epimerase
MTAKIIFLTFLLQGLLISSPILAQKKYRFRWSVAAHLPDNKKPGKQPGLAGAFAGYINRRIIIAGGANFPDSMPWQGGKKVYWNDIYIMTTGNKEKYGWKNTGEFKLKENIAYGASVNTRDGIVCIGGENENGISKKVFLLHTDNPENKIEFIDLPELPLTLTNLSAVSVGSNVFVAGGETTNGVSNRFFRLDIHKYEHGWIELAPVPVEVSHAVMVMQLKGLTPHIYLMGGRKKNANGISDIYSSLFEYSIEKNEWTKKNDMPYAVSAGLGIGGEQNEIVFIGGDKGEIFHKVEMLMAAIAAEKDEIKKRQLIKEKNQLQINHPGFSKEVLVYNIVTDEWKSVGQIPFDSPVTTTIVKGDHKFYIPGGEIKAGIRTTQILMLK